MRVSTLANYLRKHRHEDVDREASAMDVLGMICQSIDSFSSTRLTEAGPIYFLLLLLTKYSGFTGANTFASVTCGVTITFHLLVHFARLIEFSDSPVCTAVFLAHNKETKYWYNNNIRHVHHVQFTRFTHSI